MKKIAKLSLVAAVAVAGLTTASAQSLETAIKNVDVSGQFRFRTNNKDVTKDANVNNIKEVAGTDVEIEIGIKAPITDNIKAVFKIDNANDDTDGVTKGAVNIEDYYFSYNKDSLTINAGQQNIPGRMTDGAQGDGLVVLKKVGGFTIGGAAFLTNSVGKAAAGGVPGIRDRNVYSVLAMGKAGPVSLLGQYAAVQGTTKAFNIKADAKVTMANVGVEHTAQELEKSHPSYNAATADKRSTTKLWASAKMNKISAKLAYVTTGKNGSGSIDSGAETASELLLWNAGSAGMADLSAFVVDASFAVSPKVSLRAAYLGGDYGTNMDVSEVLVQASYKVAKNLSTYVRFADVEKGASEFTRGRIEAKYSF